MNIDIAAAVEGRSKIEFSYRGHLRVGEPHVYGIIGGIEQLLLYQTGGSSSSGGVPGWRRFRVSEIQSLHIGSRGVTRPRPGPSGRHSAWDHRYAFVQ